MAMTLDGKLVVAISSRALFDFEEENQIFETGDDRAYMELQRARLDLPAKPGVAFSLVKKLLAFNESASPAGGGGDLVAQRPSQRFAGDEVGGALCTAHHPLLVHPW